jgi:hypothetical protein
MSMPMLRKTFAALLLLLAASPFTAPFATCDVTTLFGQETLLKGLQVSSTPAGADASAVCSIPRRTRARAKAASHAVLTSPVERAGGPRIATARRVPAASVIPINRASSPPLRI